MGKFYMGDDIEIRYVSSRYPYKDVTQLDATIKRNIYIYMSKFYIDGNTEIRYVSPKYP